MAWSIQTRAPPLPHTYTHSNQFGQQEPGSNAEIQEFVKGTYGATFPVFGKVKKWMHSPPPCVPNPPTAHTHAHSHSPA